MENNINGGRILERLELWQETFQSGWLDTYRRTGQVDWKQYRPPINKQTIPSTGIDLADSRLMLVTSSGAYLPDEQTPFNAGDPLGDYTTRTIPSTIELKNLAYAHDHYDHAAVNKDPQVLIPMEHLRDMAAKGLIGHLTDMVSFMGYQPDATRVINETIPSILHHAGRVRADAVLLVPS